VAGEVQGRLEASPPEVPRLPRTETQLTQRLVRETAVLRCSGMSVEGIGGETRFAVGVIEPCEMEWAYAANRFPTSRK